MWIPEPKRMKAPYSRVRLNKVVVRYPPLGDKEFPIGDQRMARMRVDRTGVLSTRQYQFIWGEQAAIGKYIRTLVPVAIHSKLHRSKNRKGILNIEKLPQFYSLFRSDMLYGKSPELHRLLHDLTNVNGVFYLSHKLKIKPSEAFYDGETSIMVPSPKKYHGCELLHPDAVIAKADQIVFLETDMGTEDFATLRGKADLYKKLFESGMLQQMGYQKISVVMYSYSKRLAYIDRNGCLSPITQYVEYLDFLDNPFNYHCYPYQSENDFEDFERAILQLKKSWNEDMAVQWGKRSKYKFRDPEEFEKQILPLVDPIFRPMRH